MKNSRMMFIINPKAGGGRPLKIWDDLRAALRSSRIGYDYVFTDAPRQASRLAEQASKDGYGTIVPVGGDGTIFEVVNGLMLVPRKKRPAMGIIPCGKGGDFCRTPGIPGDLKSAVALLSSGEKRAIDIGQMTYCEGGNERTGYFANITGLGFDAEVNQYANNTPGFIAKIIGGTPVYLYSLLINFITYREKDIRLEIDGISVRAAAMSIVCANCQYFGGKMRIAPHAKPDDGLFDIVIVGAGYGNPIIDSSPDATTPVRSFGRRFVAKTKMLQNIPRIFNGSHIKDPSIVLMRGKSIKVSSPERLLIQSDGEVIGHAPFYAEIIPSALELIAP
jgi:diacylglycerol kinase (ATP)